MTQESPKKDSCSSSLEPPSVRPLKHAHKHEKYHFLSTQVFYLPTWNTLAWETGESQFEFFSATNSKLDSQRKRDTFFHEHIFFFYIRCTSPRNAGTAFIAQVLANKLSQHAPGSECKGGQKSVLKGAKDWLRENLTYRIRRPLQPSNTQPSQLPPHPTSFPTPSLPSSACQCGLSWLTDNKRHKNPLIPLLSLLWNESLPCQGLGCWNAARRYPAIYCPVSTPEEASLGRRFLSSLHTQTLSVHHHTYKSWGIRTKTHRTKHTCKRARAHTHFLAWFEASNMTQNRSYLDSTTVPHRQEFKIWFLDYSV